MVVLDDDPEAEPRLRERKKLRTRASIVGESQRLFAEKGYAATTLEEVCLAAEVALPTLFRYFETKAHLALAPTIGWMGKLRAQVEQPGRDRPTLQIWRAHMEFLSSPEVARSRRRRLSWMEGEPALRSLSAELDVQLESILTAGLAADAGREPDDDLHGRLVAAALVRGAAVVFRRWAARREPYDRLAGQQDALIDFIQSELPRQRAPELHDRLTTCHRTPWPPREAAGSPKGAPR